MEYFFNVMVMECTAVICSTRVNRRITDADSTRVWPFAKNSVDFLGDNWHGLCRFDFEDDGSYDGEWMGERMHGHGRLKEANGDKYEGQFQVGKQHGEGKNNMADGGWY